MVSAPSAITPGASTGPIDLGMESDRPVSAMYLPDSWPCPGQDIDDQRTLDGHEHAGGQARDHHARSEPARMNGRRIPKRGPAPRSLSTPNTGVTTLDTSACTPVKSPKVHVFAPGVTAGSQRKRHKRTSETVLIAVPNWPAASVTTRSSIQDCRRSCGIGDDDGRRIRHYQSVPRSTSKAAPVIDRAASDAR